MRACVALGLGAVLGATLSSSGCFDGSVTLGSACQNSAQCGDGQSCTNTVCGKCGDGKVQEGEVCFGPSTEKVVAGEVVTMLVFSVREDLDVLVLAVNGDCEEFGLGEAGTPCWRAVFVVPDGEGQVQVIQDGTDVANSGHVDALATGDFNGDGITDLVGAAGELDAIQAVFGETESTASGQTVIPLGEGSNPTTVYTADLDADGDDDIVVGAGVTEDLSEVRNDVGVVLSNGDDTFQTPVGYATAAVPRVAPPSDVDGDGDLDLVVVGIEADGQAGSVVQVLLNDGGGSFTLGSRTSLSVAVLPWAADIGDLDGDGHPDLAVSLITGPVGEESLPGMLAVLRGDGEGGFGELEEYDTGHTPLFVSLRDINGDEKLDALVANADDDKISFYLNSDGGERVFRDQQQLDVGYGPIAIQAAHLDENAVEDLAVSTSTGVLSIALSEF